MEKTQLPTTKDYNKLIDALCVVKDRAVRIQDFDTATELRNMEVRIQKMRDGNEKRLPEDSL